VSRSENYNQQISHQCILDVRNLPCLAFFAFDPHQSIIATVRQLLQAWGFIGIGIG
jgi:hypothetical protein